MTTKLRCTNVHTVTEQLKETILKHCFTVETLENIKNSLKPTNMLNMHLILEINKILNDEIIYTETNKSIN